MKIWIHWLKVFLFLFLQNMIFSSYKHPGRASVLQDVLLFKETNCSSNLKLSKFSLAPATSRVSRAAPWLDNPVSQCPPLYLSWKKLGISKNVSLLLTRSRPGHDWPIRGQNPGQVITLDQSEATKIRRYICRHNCQLSSRDSRPARPAGNFKVFS